MTVHPHARGEQERPARQGERLIRFTPTHVGSSAAGSHSGTTCPVHPHARGEQGLVTPVTAALLRFTPTHVGSSGHGLANGSAVYGSPPRTWGAGAVRACGSCRTPGSPPRTWGAVELFEIRHGRGRFTPTHVGSRIGEGLCWPGRFGSPPRTWGADATGVYDRRVCRFTPTHVGSRSLTANAYNPCPVHPHARGEQELAIKPVVGYAGSPPRTWGAGRFARRYLRD